MQNTWRHALAGLTHYADGAVEYMELERFEREFELYHQVIRIPFFQSYRKWKSFIEWKTNVKTHLKPLEEKLETYLRAIMKTNLKIMISSQPMSDSADPWPRPCATPSIKNPRNRKMLRTAKKVSSMAAVASLPARAVR